MRYYKSFPNKHPHKGLQQGFTLIELLIVVAIIAILAAIAIPNFLAAQTRSKVSRAKTEMRTLATALESFAVDNAQYPRGYIPRTGFAIGWGTPDLLPWYLPRLITLTTPIAYISSIPMDPFNPGSDRAGVDWSKNDNASYIYYTAIREDIEFLHSRSVYPSPNWVEENPSAVWRLASYGPARKRYYSAGNFYREHQIGLKNFEYDPTNGTISTGFIIRVGP